MTKGSTVLVLIDTKTLLCKRFSGRTCVLKVQATEPLFAYEVEQIRARPETIGGDPEPELA
jgi:hypothetical protein